MSCGGGEFPIAVPSDGKCGHAEPGPRTTRSRAASGGFVHARVTAPSWPTVVVSPVTAAGGVVSPGFLAPSVTGLAQFPAASSVKTA